MLNTDLHNPAISPKISASEYVASCRRCVPLARAPEPPLLDIYASIVAHPLQIAPKVDRVDSTIHASESADDTESGPSFSIYSTLPSHIAAAANGAVTGTPQELAAAPGQASTTAMGGGTPIGVPPAAAPSQLPEVDWNVAYWNLVDAWRSTRASAARALVPTALAQRLPSARERVEAAIQLCASVTPALLFVLMMVRWVRA